jgi:hypothetical protein
LRRKGMIMKIEREEEEETKNDCCGVNVHLKKENTHLNNYYELITAINYY